MFPKSLILYESINGFNPRFEPVKVFELENCIWYFDKKGGISVKCNKEVDKQRHFSPDCFYFKQNQMFIHPFSLKRDPKKSTSVYLLNSLCGNAGMDKLKDLVSQNDCLHVFLSSIDETKAKNFTYSSEIPNSDNFGSCWLLPFHIAS